MFKDPKEQSIERLEKELYVAHKNGFIFRSTHMYETTFADSHKIVGIEILFSDDVTVEKISKIKRYIESKYKFYVDDTTYMDPVKPTKIIIVRY